MFELYVTFLDVLKRLFYLLSAVYVGETGNKRSRELKH